MRGSVARLCERTVGRRVPLLGAGGGLLHTTPHCVVVTVQGAELASCASHTEQAVGSNRCGAGAIWKAPHFLAVGVGAGGALQWWAGHGVASFAKRSIGLPRLGIHRDASTLPVAANIAHKSDPSPRHESSQREQDCSNNKVFRKILFEVNPPPIVVAFHWGLLEVGNQPVGETARHHAKSRPRQDHNNQGSSQQDASSHDYFPGQLHCPREGSFWRKSMDRSNLAAKSGLAATLGLARIS